MLYAWPLGTKTSDAILLYFHPKPHAVTQPPDAVLKGARLGFCKSQCPASVALQSDQAPCFIAASQVSVLL